MLPTVMPTLIAILTRRRAPRRLRPLEPADMGTAFGMEQWLDERDQGATPVVAAQIRRRTWMPRWLQGAAMRRARS